ncbi:GTP-ase activating protein [Angomonas deanei]|uniref:GTPase activating protein for Arf, putative n=1 Tax=Angomonas deanei TaxID=59799 RepID=A0A7G2C4C9_9TRYP|nr:GTP-ase activating protein [Angomonas deanei]CAD2214658.1 Putative GTPase activating protein for Arf, putative [Angomonas deanei]|eukprot:EPY24327.1 GTP-ase activating protein [Angomonas deanei]
MTISLETLVVTAEGQVAWENSCSALHTRTMEIHSDHALYFFQEPKGSLAKIFKEQVFLDGCIVVDCGCVGKKQVLAVFLESYEYAEKLDSFGNTQGALLPKPSKGGDSRLPVFLFFAEKGEKWRFLNAITFLSGNSGRQASGFMSSPTNHFEDVINYPPTRKRAVSVLSNHVILQLDDVLKGGEDDKGEHHSCESHSRRNSACDSELPEFPVDGDAGVSKYPDSFAQKEIYKICIEGVDGNKTCADCGEDSPMWAVLQPFGVFVCIDCIGTHRKLWAGKCRGADLDDWPSADIAYMASRGNQLVNEELEYCVRYPEKSVEVATGQVAVKPCRSHSSPAVREKYIVAKYADKSFTREAHPDVVSRVPPTVDESYHNREAREVSITGFMSRIREEGPPNYVGYAEILIKELTGPLFLPGAVCVLSNGFQELRTGEGRRILNVPNTTAWDQSVQIGVIEKSAPIYCTVHKSKGELVAAGSFELPGEVLEGDALMLGIRLPWTSLNKKKADGGVQEWNVSVLITYRRLTD